MQKFQCLLFVLKQSYICYYIICIIAPLMTCGKKLQKLLIFIEFQKLSRKAKRNYNLKERHKKAKVNNEAMIFIDNWKICYQLGCFLKICSTLWYTIWQHCVETVIIETCENESLSLSSLLMSSLLNFLPVFKNFVFIDNFLLCDRTGNKKALLSVLIS